MMKSIIYHTLKKSLDNLINGFADEPLAQWLALPVGRPPTNVRALAPTLVSQRRILFPGWCVGINSWLGSSIRVGFDNFGSDSRGTHLRWRRGCSGRGMNPGA
jgi:hypothetical protein